MEFSHRAKEVVDASTEILGFNPKSTKEEIFPVMMTPTMAKHILANHNNRNRKIVPAQRNEISKSVTAFGWLFTGDSCAFDITGNLTEFQHRLEEIANGLETRLVHVATGVKSDTFTKAAPAKNRTKFDVIWRDDKSATKEEVTTLEQLLFRRRGKGDQAVGAETLTLLNASRLFAEWKDYIRIGMNISSTFFHDKKVAKFDPWRRSFNAWATLMVRTEKAAESKQFLSLLKTHLTTSNKCQLFTEMDTFFRSESVAYLTGTKKTEQVHYILCKATDRFLLAPKGDIEFNLDYADSNHSKMLVKSSTYRSFLFNAQGLKKVK